MILEQPLVDLPAGVRWIAYLALFPLIGAPMFRGLARRIPAADDAVTTEAVARARLIGVLAALILVFTAALRLYLQAQAFSDPGTPVTGDGLRLILDETAWGTGWKWQAGAGLLALTGFVVAGFGSAGWVIVWLGGFASIIAAPLTGHAIEHPWGARIGAGLHAIHLLGGALWLGTLFVLLLSVFPATRLAPPNRRESALAAVVNGYSPLALAGAGTAVGAGLLLAWKYLGSIGAITGTAYGLSLLLKLALVGGVAALGAHNWRRVRPALGSAPASERLRRSATAELALGTALLAVTAVLVALPAPAM